MVARAFITRSVSIVSAAVLLGCTPDTPINLFEETTPIKIGATMSQTGAYATQGSAALNGYRLCEAHLNSSGGVLQRPIELIVYDDESNAARAQELYSKLIEEDQVDAIWGPYGSTLTEAVAPITEAHRMVHVSPLAATTSIWEQGREYLFMVLPPAEVFLTGVIAIAEQHGLEKIAVIQEDQLFPRAAGQGASEEVTERDMSLVLHETYPSGLSDFSDLADAIAASGAEVVAMAASALDDFIAMQNALTDHGVELAFFGTSGAVQEFYDALGERAEGVLGLSAWEPTLDNPGVDEFTQSYRDRFDREPSFHAAGAYGTCQIWTEAVRRANSLTADSVRRELLDMDIFTVFGRFRVDERGYQEANQGVIIQWQEGEKVVVWPPDQAKAAIRR
ncbi:amino acid ABC transporter substrate-binding protein [Aliidiomarina indica]|uniref:amino acid ABC transporter substrate-binding protein n=1 Tax=Aliidiomarina indica TaxID=2749147 RepID=UPI00188E7764|nr:amino acid ABC transporter substrate-binding protein [Aliidiomarina indica]